MNSYIKNLFVQDFAPEPYQCQGRGIKLQVPHFRTHIFYTKRQIRDLIRGDVCRSKERSHFSITGRAAGGGEWFHRYLREGRQIPAVCPGRSRRDGVGDLFEAVPEARGTSWKRWVCLPAEYKKPIPKYAKTIGIVTASTGAAIHDIINITARRNPYVQLILYPALVQGQDARFSIVNGIRTLDSMGLDVLIVGRGGGSMEDLWAFNEEVVARAIFECETPVISAVGHETDVTIADYVADLRAPTPSAAAELAVFDYRQFENRLEVLREALNRGVERNLERKKAQVEQYQMKLKLHHPERILNDHRQRLVQIQDQMERRIEERLTDRKHRLALLAGRLHSLSPLEQLSRGFGFVTDKDGKPVASVKKLQKEESLQIRLADGRVETRILKIEGLEPGSGELEEETYGGN